MSRSKSARTIHPESLMNFPLIRQMLTDPGVSFKPRAIDQTWYYRRAMKVSVSGFNPMQGAVLYPAISRMADWLKAPDGPTRKLNLGDELSREAVFASHDYLHVWSYQAVQELVPKLGFTTKAITKKNIEDFAFCHLVTEAVATVGLDYWVLCQKELNHFVNAGTLLGPLTVPYREEFVDEYRRFNPILEVQSAKFFDALAEFYCTGAFIGFDETDVVQSAILQKWMEKELGYGEKQREYIRLWLANMSHETITYTPEELGAPLLLDKPWRVKVVSDLGEMLWEKVKFNTLHKFRRRVDPRDTWKGPAGRPPDFRFLNLNEVRGDLDQFTQHLHYGPNSDENFEYFFYQYISQFKMTDFDVALCPLFKDVITKKSVPLAKALFKGLKPIERTTKEPRDMLVLN